MGNPKPCTTHHNACDCREEHFKELSKALAIATTALNQCANNDLNAESIRRIAWVATMDIELINSD